MTLFLVLLMGICIGALLALFWPKIVAKVTSVNQKLDKPTTPAP